MAENKQLREALDWFSKRQSLRCSGGRQSKRGFADDCSSPRRTKGEKQVIRRIIDWIIDRLFKDEKDWGE